MRLNNVNLLHGHSQWCMRFFGVFCVVFNGFCSCNCCILLLFLIKPLLVVCCYCNSFSVSNKFVLIIAPLGNAFLRRCLLSFDDHKLPCLVKLKHKLLVVTLLRG